jgi:SAM-dependent methyltransferase
MKPKTTCELCGFDGPMTDFYPSRRIVQCPECGLVFYDPAAGVVSPEELYTEAYFAGAEYRDYLADERALRRNFSRRVDELRKLKPHGRLLEVGCAYGLFLDEARPHYEVIGMDITSGPTEYARRTLGLDARTVDFLDAPDEPEAYDLICMWDTLEHLTHPVRYIEKAARWLRPGGRLVMTTNDIDSFVAKFRGEKWRQIHPPTHLFYFSAATLTHAAAQAGLTRTCLRYPGVCRGYKSMVHGLFGDGLTAGLLTLGGRLDFTVRLNLRDIMMLTAEKT